MNILVVGLNHRTAPVEVREKLAFSGGHLREALASLAERRANNDPSCQEAVLLSTCNRTELYALVEDIHAGREALMRFLAGHGKLPIVELEGHVCVHANQEAVAHLFRVAAGIDSMIVGEHEILGQVREAYHLATACKAAGPLLGRLFRKSISVGKRARTETAISRNGVSVSYAAVELARNVFGDLTDCRALVVGAGEASEQTLKALVDNGVTEVTIINRTRHKAEAIARWCNGRVLAFNRVAHALWHADIVISSTAAPHPVIRRETVEQAMGSRGRRPLLIIDIAVPRDVDPTAGRVENVHLYDIDDLERVAEANRQRRRQEIPKVEAIVREELDDFMTWFQSLQVLPTVTELRDWAHDIRQTELQQALRRLGALSERQQAIVEALSQRIVNKLLHVPTVNLKERANGHDGHLYALALRELFALEGGNGKNGRDGDHQA
jgi:glutamyl-tRNA reductase